MLITFDLVDVDASVLSPTWTNGRIGIDRIHKCIDRFLVKGPFLQNFQRYRSWMGQAIFSDNWPVFLQLEDGNSPRNLLFKFNCYWLENGDFFSTI